MQQGVEALQQFRVCWVPVLCYPWVLACALCDLYLLAICCCCYCLFLNDLVGGGSLFCLELLELKVSNAAYFSLTSAAKSAAGFFVFFFFFIPAKRSTSGSATGKLAQGLGGKCLLMDVLRVCFGIDERVREWAVQLSNVSAFLCRC